MYFKMGEVTKLVGVQAHVLRYWEKEIPAIRPGHSSANQRRYRRRDVELFREVRRLLYEEKFTLAGARKHLTGPAAPEMPPDPDAFVHDFDADPALNDLTATIAEHDMYSPDLLQEMQETITKTLSDLTTSIQEHDASGSDLLQELHDAITKTSSARPVMPPFARGPVPTAADAIAAHRVSQGAAAYIERAASKAAVMAHTEAQAQKPTETPTHAAASQAAVENDQDESLQADAQGQETVSAAESDDSVEPIDAPAQPTDTATSTMESVSAAAAGDGESASAAQVEAKTEADRDVDTDTGLPAATTGVGADAADDLQASNECEDVLTTSSHNDGIDAGRDNDAWDAGGDPEDVQPDTDAGHRDADMSCTDAADVDAGAAAGDGVAGQGDATGAQDDDSDTFRAWDHPIDPDVEAARLADEAEQGYESTYVLYRTDEDGTGPDISYGSADATLSPDIAYVSGDAPTGPEIAYVSGETRLKPDVSYGIDNPSDPFDVAHASGEADAAFNVFHAQADDSQTIELPCMTPQSIPVPDVAYASGLYGTPEVASDSLHMAGSGLSGLSGLPTAALHLASRGQGDDDGDQASVGAWGASVEPGHGMYNAAALASALPAACYGADDTDIEEMDEAEPNHAAGLQAAATLTDLDAGASVYHAWDTEAPLDEARDDMAMSDASNTDTYAAQEALDDLPDSPYAAFLSADPVTCAWPDTSGSAFDFAPVAAEAEAFEPPAAASETSEDPAVLAAWDAMAAIGVEDSRDAPAADSAPTLTREATGAAEASLEASRLQLRDTEVTPTPGVPNGRIGAAASFEEGEEPSGGFYAYVEVPAEGLEPTEAIEAHATAQEGFYTPVDPSEDTRAAGPAANAAPIEPVAAKPLTIPSLDVPAPRVEAYSEAGQTQVVGEACSAPASDPWASSMPATPISPATPVMSEAPTASAAPLEPAELATPAMSAEPASPASPVAADMASETAGIMPPEPAPAMSPAEPTNAADAMAAIVSATPIDTASAALASGPAATAHAPMAPATAADAFHAAPLSASMVPAEPMAPIASATPFDPMPSAAPMVPTEGLDAMAAALPIEAMPLPAPMPPAVPTASLAAMSPVELMAAIASLRPSKPVTQQAPEAPAESEALEEAPTPSASIDTASTEAPHAGVLEPEPPVAPPTAVVPPVLVVPASTASATGAAVPRVIMNASRAVNALRGRAFTEVLKSLAGDYDGPHAAAAATMAALSQKADVGPAPATNSVVASQAADAEHATADAALSEVPAQACAAPDPTADHGDPEDVGTASDPGFADASYGMDLSPDDLANAESGMGEPAGNQTERKAAGASDASYGVDASEASDDTGETLAQTAGALGLANEALADASTAMAVAAEAVADVAAAAEAVAAPKPPHDPEAPEEQAKEVPATPPPFEHPPYFETPAHDTLAVQLLRQKLRSGLQDILRIATE